MNEQIIACRLKQARKEKGFTLSELAEKSNFSKGLLSKIENNKVSPPIGTLLRLSNTLGIKMGALFQEDDIERSVVITKKEALNLTPSRKTAAGFHYNPLASGKADKSMEPFLLRVTHKRSKKTDNFKHTGDEFIHVKKGRLRITIGPETYILNEDDSIYFDADIKHSLFVNKGEEALLIVVACRH